MIGQIAHLLVTTAWRILERRAGRSRQEAISPRAPRHFECVRIMSPEVELETAFILDPGGRIQSTRESQARRGPLFTIIRSSSECAWAVRDDVPNDAAEAIETLARSEPPIRQLETPPLHAARYLALTGGCPGFHGPAFRFPELSHRSSDVVVVDDERLLERNFQGWTSGEIAAGRAPVMALTEAGYPVSICFCARRSDAAAAAGLETAAAFRGRGLAPRVVDAWAVAIRDSGRIPLYSAAWSNVASLAVARKVGLVPYASFWSVST
jgi:hypothetical protein